LPGCHTQVKNLDELKKHVKEAIDIYLEAERFKPKEGIELVACSS
jgi:predicted RNase H-like HicB family nuclease